MRQIYHILSSNISHHNHTLLAFFQNELCHKISLHQHFFYVVSQQDLALDFPQLTLKQFSSRQAITKALIAKLRENPTACFILHGQFNPWIWLILAFSIVPGQNFVWHIWGGDLYETANSWKFKLFYPIRRLAQKKIRRVWATKGDLDYLWRNIRTKTAYDRVIYFPTKLPQTIHFIHHKTTLCETDKLTLLLGNSGDSTNNHIEALTQIRKTLGKNVRIIIPMGYPANNESYIQQVERHGKRLFCSEDLQIVRKKLNFTDYITLIKKCDLGYFNFTRQQGIGTIGLLIQHNIPCVLNSKNPFIIDMQAENVPYLIITKTSRVEIKKVRQILATIDKSKIAFLYPNYIKQWQEHLTELTNK